MPLTPGPALVPGIQASIPITSPNSMRLGNFGRALIINTSFVATVWVSESSDVRNGLGVPIGPGSWVVATGGSDLFAALGTDSQSVGQTATVVITSAVESWSPAPGAIAAAVLNSGVIAVDQPAVLLSRVGANPIANPAVGLLLGVFDVSRYRSVIFGYVPNVAGHTISLDFQWCSSVAAATAGAPTAGELMGEDTFRWVAADTSTLEAKVLPVRGAALRVVVTLGAGGGAGDFMTLMASNREVIPTANLGGSADRIIASNTQLLGAAATVTLVPFFRYDGPASVAAAFVPGAAGESVDWQLIDRATGVSMAAGVLVNTPAASVPAQTVPVVCPRSSWQLSLVNRSAAARTVTLAILAAPEST